jgi:hypothetical protein
MTLWIHEQPPEAGRLLGERSGANEARDQTIIRARLFMSSTSAEPQPSLVSFLVL